MKDKIMLFVIGVLVGAVISTGTFCLYSFTNNKSFSNYNMQMDGGRPPMIHGSKDNKDDELPDKPNDNNKQDDNQKNSTS